MPLISLSQMARMADLKVTRNNEDADFRVQDFGYQELECIVLLLKLKDVHNDSEQAFLRSCRAQFNSILRYESLYNMKRTRFPDTTPHTIQRSAEASSQAHKRQRTQ